MAELLGDLGRHWGFENLEDAYQVTDNIPFHEAGLLKLNCDKALLHLKWESNLDYEETLRLVGDWYTAFYREQKDMYVLTLEQITSYELAGAERNRVWTR